MAFTLANTHYCARATFTAVRLLLFIFQTVTKQSNATVINTYKCGAAIRVFFFFIYLLDEKDVLFFIIVVYFSTLYECFFFVKQKRKKKYIDFFSIILNYSIFVSYSFLQRLPIKGLANNIIKGHARKPTVYYY